MTQEYKYCVTGVELDEEAPMPTQLQQTYFGIRMVQNRDALIMVCFDCRSQCQGKQQKMLQSCLYRAKKNTPEHNHQNVAIHPDCKQIL